ncbi:MAG: cytochrome c [Chloroflexi bacterium]|nr:cytochrome c [Chloroflexota bacterium]
MGRIGLVEGAAITLGLIIASLATAEVVSTHAAPSLQSPETTFQTKCAACHTIGGGVRSGPDLKGITASRNREWLTKFIVAPDQLLAQGDPVAKQLLAQYKVPMPNIGVSPAEAEGLLVYFDSRSGTAAPQNVPAPQASEAQLAGDPARGKEYFVGARRLQNGGPSCLACHAVSTVGVLGGGALGPDLTQTYAKFGADDLRSSLASLPFPSMRPIYNSRPLTPEEQADLAAFFRVATREERVVEAPGLLAGAGVVGAAFLLALMRVIWRGRLIAVRQPLVARQAVRPRSAASSEMPHQPSGQRR